ncbi:MAG: N-acetylmuramoyl-L-alanine amidase [Parcubacteria group bacterium]
MQKYLNIKLVYVVLAAGVFSGCSFGNVAKKTEINLNNDQAVQAPAEENAKNNNSVDTQQPQADDYQKVESPAAATKEGSADTTAPVATVPENADKNADSASVSTPKFKITDRLVSWGFAKSSGRKIDTIVIHSSYNAVGSDEYDLDDIINKEYKPNGVSPHYIIGRDGKVYRLVADQNIAYHAGVSKMPDGRTNVNNFSIGIEVVETKSDSPNSAQYSALKSLISYLKGEHNIKYVLGHSDIAPDRKDDPWNFDWGKVGGKEK